jgi:hypothetical protein
MTVFWGLAISGAEKNNGDGKGLWLMDGLHPTHRKGGMDGAPGRCGLEKDRRRQPQKQMREFFVALRMTVFFR